jgi:hypothetical protein
MAERTPEQREADFQRRLTQLREERAKDQAEGRARGEELFGEGTLGRVEQGRLPETQRLVERREAGLGGLTAAESAAAREKALGGITEQSQTELARVRAALGRQGRQLDDPSAVAQQRRILERSLRERGNVERDLLLADVALKDQRQRDLEQLVGQAQASDLARAQINAERRQRELAGQLQTEFGIAGLGSQERFGLRGLQSAEEQAAQARAFQQESLRLQEKTIDKPPPPAPKGGKIICGELHRQGILSDMIYAGDLRYAEKHVCDNTRDGYISWANFYVKLMQKSKLATKLITPFAVGWATEMAYRVGYSEKGSLLGKVLSWTGEPVCKLIGKVRRLFNFDILRGEE